MFVEADNELYPDTALNYLNILLEHEEAMMKILSDEQCRKLLEEISFNFQNSTVNISANCSYSNIG